MFVFVVVRRSSARFVNFIFCFTLWAVNDRWSHANVTSTKSSSSRKWRNDDKIDDWKSFHLSAYCWSDGVGDDTSILKLLQKTQRNKNLNIVFYKCITRFYVIKYSIKSCVFVTYMPFMLFTLALFPSLLSYKPAVCHTSLNDSNEYVCLRHLIKLHRHCIWARIERSEVTGLLYDVMLVVNVVLVMCFRIVFLNRGVAIKFYIMEFLKSWNFSYKLSTSPSSQLNMMNDAKRGLSKNNSAKKVYKYARKNNELSHHTNSHFFVSWMCVCKSFFLQMSF